MDTISEFIGIVIAAALSYILAYIAMLACSLATAFFTKTQIAQKLKFFFEDGVSIMQGDVDYYEHELFDYTDDELNNIADIPKSCLAVSKNFYYFHFFICCLLSTAFCFLSVTASDYGKYNKMALLEIYAPYSVILFILTFIFFKTKFNVKTTKTKVVNNYFYTNQVFYLYNSNLANKFIVFYTFMCILFLGYLIYLK